MICYLDMTFCTEEKCKYFSNEACDRALTEKRKKDAQDWWGSDDQYAPIAIFGNRPNCYVWKGETKWKKQQ